MNWPRQLLNSPFLAFFFAQTFLCLSHLTLQFSSQLLRYLRCLLNRFWRNECELRYYSFFCIPMLVLQPWTNFAGIQQRKEIILADLGELWNLRKKTTNTHEFSPLTFSLILHSPYVIRIRRRYIYSLFFVLSASAPGISSNSIHKKRLWTTRASLFLIGSSAASGFAKRGLQFGPRAANIPEIPLSTSSFGCITSTKDPRLHRSLHSYQSQHDERIDIDLQSPKNKSYII